MGIARQKGTEDPEGSYSIIKNIVEGFVKALHIVQANFGKTDELFRTGIFLQGFGSGLSEPYGFLPKDAAQPKPDLIITGIFVFP